MRRTSDRYEGYRLFLKQALSGRRLHAGRRAPAERRRLRAEEPDRQREPARRAVHQQERCRRSRSRCRSSEERRPCHRRNRPFSRSSRKPSHAVFRRWKLIVGAYLGIVLTAVFGIFVIPPTYRAAGQDPLHHRPGRDLHQRRSRHRARAHEPGVGGRDELAAADPAQPRARRQRARATCKPPKEDDDAAPVGDSWLARVLHAPGHVGAHRVQAAARARQPEERRSRSTGGRAGCSIISRRIEREAVEHHRRRLRELRSRRGRRTSSTA